MSEAYWIDSSAAGLDELLRRSGARREWIEEAHWLGATPENPPEGIPTGFYWPAASQHALLNLLGQAIVSGERSLLLIGQPGGGYALLAG
ncbi:MAG TPA: hypothetical protein VFF68_14435, partial [Anaerolineaceae bacterium]|nr:hypothetical protein [Anaerolineaceae bacterium]